MAGAPVDINIPAVKIVMDLEEVTDQQECLEKVQSLAWTVLGEKAKRRKQDDESK